MSAALVELEETQSGDTSRVELGVARLAQGHLEVLFVVDEVVEMPLVVLPILDLGVCQVPLSLAFCCKSLCHITLFGLQSVGPRNAHSRRQTAYIQITEIAVETLPHRKSFKHVFS